jgi:hypothetical protein
VALEQTQKRGRTTTVVHAETATAIACSTSAQPWAIEVVPPDEPFQHGSAWVTAIGVSVDTQTTPASVSQSVRLFKSRN